MERHYLYDKLLVLQGIKGLKALPVELEILFQLYEAGPLRSSDLMFGSRCSNSGFGIIKKRMTEDGLVFHYTSEIDKRVVLFDIASEIRDILKSMDYPPEKRTDNKFMLISGSDKYFEYSGGGDSYSLPVDLK